jgi:hypothetical protein
MPMSQIKKSSLLPADERYAQAFLDWANKFKRTLQTIDDVDWQDADMWRFLRGDLIHVHGPVLIHTIVETRRALRTSKASPRLRARAGENTVQVKQESLDWIKQRGARNVVEISGRTQRTLRKIVETGYKKGTPPAELADKIKRSVGLTDRQADAVDRRRALVLEQTGDATRANAIADKYAKEQLEHRAYMIAVTETKEAQEEGRDVAWADAMEEGELPKGTQRRWNATGIAPVNDKSSGMCEACEAMDGETVDFDEDFEGPDGPIRRPPLHPLCMCTVELYFP